MQNRRLVKLLAAFATDGFAACENAQLITALQRLVLSCIGEQFELDFDTLTHLSDALPPAAIATLLKCLQQGFAWHGTPAGRGEVVLAELRERITASQPLAVDDTVMIGDPPGCAKRRATVLKIDPGPPARVRLEWWVPGSGGQAAQRRSGWRTATQVQRCHGVDIGPPAGLGFGPGPSAGGSDGDRGVLRVVVPAAELWRRVQTQCGLVLTAEEKAACLALAAPAEGGGLLVYGRVRRLRGGDLFREPESEQQLRVVSE
eukprot:SAG22_NODE_3839_length_1509_cov_1.336170_2_plen_259_part_01